jgi:zinc protease
MRRRAWTALLVALLAGVGCRMTLGPAEPATATASPPLPLDPAIVEGRLANGFSYFIRENDRPENRALLWLVVDAGSLQEDDDQRGLAHLVEHMAFNGTRHFARQEMVDFLESIGMQFGPDINAYTSFDETVYMLQVPTGDRAVLEKAFVILRDWAAGVSFDPAEIDKERGVVLEEWRLGQGAASRIRDRQWPVLFRGSRYAARLPIGDPDVIRGAPHDAVRRFYRDWYRPALMALVAVGDFDAAWIERQARRRFAGLRSPAHPRPRETYPVPGHDETLVSVTTDPEATQSRVTVHYKLEREPFVTEDDYRRTMIADLHHGMLAARLDEVRRRPDPPFLFAGTSSGAMVRSRNVYSQFAAVPEGGAARGLDALLDEVERVDRHGFTEAELARQKKEYLRGYEQAWRERDKQPHGVFARELRDRFLEGEPAPGIERELDLVRRLLPGIPLDEVNGLAREWIRDRDRVVLYGGPEAAVAPPPTEADLLAALAERREVEPWVDQVRQGPLVATPPEPGEVASERTLEEIGVTEWTLSNGVRVVLKPTDFKNDEVLLAGFSPGGTSLAADGDDASASVAATLLDVGGLGEFSLTELEKALAGTVAGADAFLGEMEEEVSAHASPEDLETMFQLLYLRFTSPRFDPDAIRSWIDRQRALLEHRAASPEVAFADEMARALSRDHPRRRPWTAERIGEIRPEQAAAFYRERFADASDFTFVLVGSFELDRIRPLVLTWLGGLPSNGRRESWRDLGVRPPEQVVEVRVRKGLEPRAQVRIVFTGEAEWSRQALHDIGSLALALRIRLREVLREEMGATYGVGVGGSIQRWPTGLFSFSVGFGCAPENVEEMARTAFAEIQAVKRDGLGEDYVAKVREAQTRRREVDLRENGFWLGALATYTRHDLDPRRILAYEELVGSVTTASLRESARRYLPEDRYVIGVLLPEPEAAHGGSDAAAGAERGPRPEIRASRRAAAMADWSGPSTTLRRRMR